MIEQTITDPIPPQCPNCDTILSDADLVGDGIHRCYNCDAVCDAIYYDGEGIVENLQERIEDLEEKIENMNEFDFGE